MTLVVDSSVAVKWFVQEHGRDQALHVLDLDEREVPDLIVAEVANVIWKKGVARRSDRYPGLFDLRCAAALFRGLCILLRR